MALDKALYKKLFTIVTPIAFQFLTASLVTASDAFMLGFLDQDSLSASSLAGQVSFVFRTFTDILPCSTVLGQGRQKCSRAGACGDDALCADSGFDFFV